MDFGLEASEHALFESVRRFAMAELEPATAIRDAGAAVDRSLFERCGTAGLLGLPLPEEHGGGGRSGLDCALAFEALGEGSGDAGLFLALGAHLFACAVPLWKHGSSEQQRRYLPRLSHGRSIGAGAMTEPGAGSDTGSIATRAVRDGSGYRLTGTKTFVTNATLADVFLVFAVSDPGSRPMGSQTAFVVEAGAPGLRVGRRYETLGHRSASLAELHLDDVPVEVDARLGPEGSGALVFAEAMSWERIGLFAGHVGLQQRLLNATVARASTRQQFGRPIGSFQSVAHRIADMKVRLEAARLLVRSAAWRLDRSRDVAMHAAIAKLFASEALVASANDALQIHGAVGYVAGESERTLRDAVGTTLYSGTSEVQRMIIARWLGLP